MNLFSLFYKGLRKIKRLTTNSIDIVVTNIIFRGNNVKIGKGFKSNGRPKVDVWRQGKFNIGANFKINNGKNHNPIGRQQPCYFIVMNNAELTIGDNVGMSATAIVCSCKISIGNNVKIGGNTVIYDTDFHSLEFNLRLDSFLDKSGTKTKPVIIEDNVFIGAHSTILKGVTIGKNSIIGAGSVVTKSIPANEIWAGNPATLIKLNTPIF